MKRVLSVVKNFQNVDPAKVTETSHFIKDLGLDSLDTVEVCFCFKIGLINSNELKTTFENLVIILTEVLLVRF